MPDGYGRQLVWHPDGMQTAENGIQTALDGSLRLLVVRTASRRQLVWHPDGIQTAPDGIQTALGGI